LYELEFLNPLKDECSHGRFGKLINDIVRVYSGPDTQAQTLSLLLSVCDGIDG